MYVRKHLVTKMKDALRRSISGSSSRYGGLLTVSSALPDDTYVPTVDHAMPVDWATKLMVERHVDAVPVTKDNRVIGMFTEHDYFDKVLNESHQATRSSMVSEVGTMGSELIIARPSDSVSECLAVMSAKNLWAMPVVEDDGRAVGTISVLELARLSMEADQERAKAAQFSEPVTFPDGFVLPDGEVYHEETSDPEEILMQCASVPPDMPMDQEEYDLHVRAAESFCEGSVFPEYTPNEEMQLVESLGKAPSLDAYLPDFEREERLIAAQAEVLSHMKSFSEPSDFPEAAPVDEAVFARAP